MIISLYAGGMTLRDIQFHLLSTIGTDVSHETILRFPRKRGGIDNRGRDARETEEVRPGVS